jgi:diguanylate cyclase (GGDEF)-like protein/PAS domain S-box-containing protein
MNPLPESLGEQLFMQLLDQINDAVYMLDRDMRVVFWNRAAANITGCQAQDILGARCDDVLTHCQPDGKVLCQCGCPMRKAMEEGARTETVVYLQHRDGTRLPVSVRIWPAHDKNGQLIGAVQIFSDDVSRAMVVRRLDQLEQIADNDKLTGIRNRRFMEEQISLRLYEAQRSGARTGCIFIDIDHFKAINDQFGHDLGDTALRIVARTLSACSKATDVVGRWGGEEFVIILSDTSPREVASLANLQCAMIQRCRLEHEGRIVPLSASVGATLALPTDTPRSLVQRADHLMYQSKQLGRNRATCDLIAA